MPVSVQTDTQTDTQEYGDDITDVIMHLNTLTSDVRVEPKTKLHGFKLIIFNNNHLCIKNGQELDNTLGMFLCKMIG